MKRKIKIGIPKISIYNKNPALIKNFFIYLGCKIIVGNNSNQLAKNNLSKEICSIKQTYYDQIMMLTNECDYIIISNNCEYYQKCIKNSQFLKALYCHIDKEQALVINPYKNRFLEYFKVGLKITKNPLRIIISYYLAYKKQKNYDNNKINHNKNKLNNEKKKILLVSNYNNINNYITKEISDYLKKIDITTIISEYIQKKEALLHSTVLKNKNITKETKKIIGTIYYYRYCIKGIIYLETTMCSIDKYIINIITKEIKEMPIININETENQSVVETKLKKLIDIISKDNQ